MLAPDVAAKSRHRFASSEAVAKFVVMAETRSGRPCMAPTVCGKKCRHMHGGAPGLGAPLGNQNPLEQGHFTNEAIEQRDRAVLALFLLALSQPQTGTTAVLVDELDAGGF